MPMITSCADCGTSVVVEHVEYFSTFENRCDDCVIAEDELDAQLAREYDLAAVAGDEDLA